LNPFLLFGLLGTAVPVVIHLLSRRTARRMDFSTLDFLMNLERKSMRRVRIRQLLLLLIRVALVAAVALAMARPTLTGVSAGEGVGSTAAAVVLDASYSMNAAFEGSTLFESAKESAREVLESLDEGDEVALFVPGSEEASPERTVRDVGLVTEQLQQARSGRSAVELPASLREAARVLEDSPKPHREIHVITDFQVSAWTGIDETTLPEGIAVYFFPIGAENPPENAWVESIDFSGQILEKGSPIEFRTVIASGPGFGSHEVEVELEIDGRVVDRRPMDLGPSSRVALTFRETFAQDGLHLGSVALRGDVGLPEDDVRSFTVRTAREVPVLLVAGSPKIAHYLRAALAPEGATAGTFAVREAGPEALVSASREREAVAVLADVATLSEQELAGLKQFLSEGGGLLVFPGPQTDAASWGRLFLPKFLPGSLVGVEAPEEVLTIASFDPSHPLFDLFREDDAGLDVRVARTLSFRPQSGTAVLASYSNGQPAILESSLLPGRVLFFTSSLDPAWSDLPLRGIFLPLLHEAVRYLSESASLAVQDLEVGEGGTVRLAQLPEGGGVLLREPSGGTRAVAPEADPAGYALTLPLAHEPGFWIFESHKGDTLAALAANISPAEANPARSTPQDVRERLEGGRSVVVEEESDLARELREARIGREIGHFFLWAAAFLLLAEMILALRVRTPVTKEA
jgi:hypothetical protein